MTEVLKRRVCRTVGGEKEGGATGAVRAAAIVPKQNNTTFTPTRSHRRLFSPVGVG